VRKEYHRLAAGDHALTGLRGDLAIEPEMIRGREPDAALLPLQAWR
jgi:hypothetical protein